jgi:hypothetical protein
MMSVKLHPSMINVGECAKGEGGTVKSSSSRLVVTEGNEIEKRK